MDPRQNTAAELLRLWTPVTGCLLSCDGVINSPGQGYSPRGFYARRRPVRLLMVAEDPGPVVDADPKGGTPEDRVLHILANTGFEGVKRPGQFHVEITSALAEILGVSIEQVPEQVAFSNLVKCSPATPGYRRATQLTCYGRHLLREIEFFNPVALLAVGASARDFFREVTPPVPWFALVHPGSKRYGKEKYERERATQIAEIKGHLGALNDSSRSLVSLATIAMPKESPAPRPLAIEESIAARVPLPDTYIPTSDGEYLSWLQRNSCGFVLASDKPAYNRLHRATCANITGRPTHGAQWIRPGTIKVCSLSLDELKRWATGNPRWIRSAVVMCKRCAPD